MHMVAHDDITVEMVMAQGVISILNSSDDHVRNLRLAKIQRAGTSVVENAIHSQKGFSGGSGRWEAAACRKAIV